MTSNLSDDLGPTEPGLDQLIRTLTSGATADELAGEQAALAMFQANIHPLAPVTGMGEAPPAVPGPAPGQSRTHPTRPLRVRRLALPRFRLVVAGSAVALVGGFAAAAYAAVLPAPLQHVAYQALHSIGVPDTPHGTAGGSPPAPAPSTHRGSHRGKAAPSPSGSSNSGPGSRAQSPTPSASGSSANPPPAGRATMTAAAVAGQIPAGTPVTIDGTLTRAGRPVAGVMVRLWERSAGRGWRLAGVATTSAQGTVSMTVPDLITNTRFRLTDPDGPVSPPVTVIVVPQVTTSLTLGSRAVKDYLYVTTKDAHPGDPVQLEVYVQGSWVYLRERFLNGAGRTTFVLSAQKLQGDQVRVLLVATRRHAAAASSPVTVPPPA